MKVFFDCEFNGLVQDTQLISIGFVADDGRTFYAEIIPDKPFVYDEWVLRTVVPNLRFNTKPVYTHILSKDGNVEMLGTQTVVKQELINWLSKYKLVEIWSDCLAYDWVLFCELFGGAMNIPENIYYIPFDICTVFKLKGVDPDVSREQFARVSGGEKHNALWDAKVIKHCYYTLMDMA